MKNKLTVKDAKKNYSWRVIPISKLPDGVPIIGISEYSSKSLAEFNLIEEVIVPCNIIKKSSPKTAPATDTGSDGK